jgi:hypothetical protein
MKKSWENREKPDGKQLHTPEAIAKREATKKINRELKKLQQAS